MRSAHHRTSQVGHVRPVSVGADDVTGGDRLGRSTASHPNAVHSSVPIPQQVFHRRLVLNLGSGLLRRLHEEPIED
ncbi:MAG TPA: hypothetical protein VMM14_05980, partial [Acidimicrobiia bacterium]|nr:hypothetical protein [Acidimicrobiia bacterium]